MNDLETLYLSYQNDPVFFPLRTHSNFVPGRGPVPASIMLVGEAPGATENARQEPFVGVAGKMLEKILDNVGVPLDQVFFTNILKFRPPKNRDPLQDELIAAAHYVEKEIDIVQPHVVGLLGRHATRSLLGDYLYFKRRGQLIEGYIPLYHPMVPVYRAEKFDEVCQGYSVLKEYL